MSTYTIQLDQPNATQSSVCWRVDIWDLVDGGGASKEVVGDQHYLWVPALENWLPATVRLVLHELSAYLPGHEITEAMVTIDAKRKKRTGRAPKNSPRVLEFSREVTISVAARGWKAEVETWRDYRSLN